MDPNAGKLFDFDKEKYDVIIIGDVTAAQMKAIRPDVLTQINQQVESGAGFLMIGGYSSFGEGDWQGTAVEPLLPVDLGVRGQVPGGLYGIKMVPTEIGLRLYSHVLRLGGGDAKAEQDAWDALPGLDGVNRIAQPKQLGPTDQVLAVSKEADPKTMQPYPLLVTKDYGRGRVLAFAGDTTHRWIRDPEGKRKHDRFWRQMVLWLARQDEGDNQVRVTPDVRSLSVGDDLGFSLGMRSKNGLEVKDADYEVEVVGPNGEHTKVTPTRDGGEDRGVYRPQTAGTYTINVKAHGKDSDGQDVVRRRLGAVFGVRDGRGDGRVGGGREVPAEAGRRGPRRVPARLEAGGVSGPAAVAARREDEAEGGPGAGLEFGVVVAVFGGVFRAVHGAAGRGVVPAAALGHGVSGGRGFCFLLPCAQGGEATVWNRRIDLNTSWS